MHRLQRETPFLTADSYGGTPADEQPYRGGGALYKFNEKATERQVFEKKKLCWGIAVYILTRVEFVWWCCSLRWRRVNALKFLKDQTSFFSSSSSRPWFSGFQCHSRFRSALTGLQHISISPLSLHRLPLMSPWSSGMLTGTSMLTSLSLSAGNILLPNTREQTFSFSPSWFTIYQRLCCTAELPNSCIRY